MFKAVPPFRTQDVQEMHQMEDLLDHPLVEPVGSGYGQDFRRRQPHSTSPQDRFRISAGTMRFQPLTHWQRLRLPRVR